MRLFSRLSFLLGVLLLGIFSSHSAEAQIIDDIETAVTRGAQFNEALLDLNETTEQNETTEIDGESGVYVLKKNDIYFVRLVSGTGFSDNPTRTEDSGIDETLSTQLAVSAGVQTRIDDKYDAGVNVVVSGTEYDLSGAPDSRNVLANAYIGRPILKDKVFASVSASYGRSYDGDFEQGTEFYGGTVSLSTSHLLKDNIVWQPRLTASRQLSEVDEQKSYSLSADSNITWAIAPKWQASASVAYTHRIYDNFFEDVTFVKRKDDQIRVGVGVSRQLNNSSSLSVSYSYTNQDSAFFLSDYSAHDGGLNFQISKRF